MDKLYAAYIVVRTLSGKMCSRMNTKYAFMVLKEFHYESHFKQAHVCLVLVGVGSL